MAEPGSQAATDGTEGLARNGPRPWMIPPDAADGSFGQDEETDAFGLTNTPDVAAARACVNLSSGPGGDGGASSAIQDDRGRQTMGR
jgi:hypothetical protein